MGDAGEKLVTSDKQKTKSIVYQVLIILIKNRLCNARNQLSMKIYSVDFVKNNLPST